MDRLAGAAATVAARNRRESVHSVFGQQNRGPVRRHGRKYRIQRLFLKRGKPAHRVQAPAELKQQIQLANGAGGRRQTLRAWRLQVKSVLLAQDDRGRSWCGTGIELQPEIGGTGIARRSLKYEK